MPRSLPEWTVGASGHQTSPPSGDPTQRSRPGRHRAVVPHPIGAIDFEPSQHSRWGVRLGATGDRPSRERLRSTQRSQYTIERTTRTRQGDRVVLHQSLYHPGEAQENKGCMLPRASTQREGGIHPMREVDLSEHTLTQRWPVLRPRRESRRSFPVRHRALCPHSYLNRHPSVEKRATGSPRCSRSLCSRPPGSGRESSPCSSERS